MGDLKMPFQKGHKKFGGVTKGQKQNKNIRPTGRLVDQLRDNGIDIAKEIARGLRSLAPDKRFTTIVFDLLPYLVPRLKEKQIDPAVEAAAAQAAAMNSTPQTDEEIIKALENDGKQTDKRASNSTPVAKGLISLPDAPGPEVDLSDLAKEQEE